MTLIANTPSVAMKDFMFDILEVVTFSIAIVVSVLRVSVAAVGPRCQCHGIPWFVFACENTKKKRFRL